MKTLGTLVVTVALIAGMVGCGEATPPARYNLTMVVAPAGSGNAIDLTNASPYAGGTVVNITELAASGYQFVNWTAPAGTFANANAAQTTFTMPAQNVTVTANFAPFAEANKPPVAVIKVNPTSADTPPLTAQFDGSASYDPDGNIVSYQWDFGDGTSGSGVTVSHVYTKTGTFTATLTVTDNEGATSTASVTITIKCDVTHEGDLIISGDEVFTIEGITYCQTGNIIVKDNATLNLIDARLAFQAAGRPTYIRTQDHASLKVQHSEVLRENLNEIALDGMSNVLIEDSRLDWFHCHESSTITVRNSTLRHFHPHSSCSVEVSESVIDNIAILLDTPHEQHTVSNIHPGFYEHWNFQVQNPEANVGYNVILINSSVASFDVFNNVGPVTAFINNSTLGSIGCYLGYSYSIANTKTDVLTFDQFFGNIAFDNTTITARITANGSDVAMTGTLTVHTASASFLSARVQRSYNVFVKDSDGEPLPHVSLKLYDFNGVEVWSGETDGEGEASFDMTFNDNNYNKTWRLKAPALGIEGEVRFLTDTPMVITTPG